MADITIDRNNDIVVQGGQRGYVEQYGIGQFNSTDASGDLPCKIARVLSVQITPLGTPAADEIISVNEVAAVSNGVLARPSDQRLTITRTGAAKTAGLRFFYSIRGLAG